MNNYVATFYTHVSALMTSKAFAAKGIENHLAPVPRKLSSSCGTCVMYMAEAPALDLLDADAESAYKIENDGSYSLLYKNE